MSSNENLDFGDLNDMSGILLQRSFYSATRYFGKYMGKDFKPGFYTTLSLLERNPGITQKTLAASIQRDTSTLVPFLNHMEKHGWVVRKRSPTDKRAHELHLTKAGFKQAEKLDNKVRALEQRIEDSMGSKDAQRLKQLLKKYEKIIDSFAED